MMPFTARRVAALSLLLFVYFTGTSQPFKREVKPFKVLTSGLRLTIKSTQPIRDVMLWTSGGDRVIENKNIRDRNVTLDIPIYQKTFFLMVGLENGKVYTEKIGIR
ncbi:MAG: hypothetical protein ACO25B_13930 [Chitinophagaceae bacterium]